MCIREELQPKLVVKLSCPVWWGLFLVVDSNPPLYRIQDRNCRYFTIHHDRLNLCQNRVIPIWLRFFLYRK